MYVKFESDILGMVLERYQRRHFLEICDPETPDIIPNQYNYCARQRNLDGDGCNNVNSAEGGSDIPWIF